MFAESQHPDLAGMLTGELDTTRTVAAADHLEACETCRDELAQLAVGHALLVRSAKTLSSAQDDEALPPLSPPRSRPRHLALVVGAAAAVVGVAAGALTTAALTDAPSPSPGPSEPAAVAVAPLDPVEGVDPKTHGEVEMYGAEAGHTRMRILTTRAPR